MLLQKRDSRFLDNQQMCPSAEYFSVDSVCIQDLSFALDEIGVGTGSQDGDEDGQALILVSIDVESDPTIEPVGRVIACVGYTAGRLCVLHSLIRTLRSNWGENNCHE
jgi:hypothetical protein